MKILSHITWAAVIVFALASISSCREDSEEKYNPNFLYLSRSAGFPPLSPSRTVHATFTAHGSCNSVNYLSF